MVTERSWKSGLGTCSRSTCSTTCRVTPGTASSCVPTSHLPSNVSPFKFAFKASFSSSIFAVFFMFFSTNFFSSKSEFSRLSVSLQMLSTGIFWREIWKKFFLERNWYYEVWNLSAGMKSLSRWDRMHYWKIGIISSKGTVNYFSVTDYRKQLHDRFFR